MSSDEPLRLRCFLVFPNSPEFSEVRKAAGQGAAEAGFKIIAADQLPVLAGRPIREALIGELARADCAIADITEPSPTVYFELGLAQAMGKGLIILEQKRSQDDIPLGVGEFQRIIYERTPDSLAILSRRIAVSLREYRQTPQRSPVRGAARLSVPFFVDWERLDRREVENLCRELLAQMGFQRLEWGKITPEIDLVAELPRKDPDGFEYRELWLISMGLHAPAEMLLEMAGEEPDFLVHRVLKYSDRFERFWSKGIETSITFLVILFREFRESAENETLLERLNRRRLKRGAPGYSLRFRVWDQAYLTSLIHQFPQIGYKYFSDEGRIRSKTRKSYEELYRENSDLVARQAKLIADLEEEKNRRVRAERDSVWKDISFSAAHKIGNPIFAIETDLDPLVRRVREGRLGEADAVIANIRSSVEKAKAFVEQFKSLAQQEIKPAATFLRPLLEDASQPLASAGIASRVDCAPELLVWADPDRLAEGIDELVANAKHWLDKPEKRIDFCAIFPVPEPLPSFLDSAAEYVLLHVKDNGCGVPVANKQRIFDAFFTTYDHGTGLGLALVRRIVDGLGGGIAESGVPGQGADFELYLPVPPAEQSGKASLTGGSKRHGKE